MARPKPAPDLLAHVLKETGARTDNCILIEDGASGALAARELGIPVFGFVGGRHCTEKTSEKLLNAGVELIFDDMRELPSLLGKFTE